MERLTERFSNGQAAVRGCGNNCKHDFIYCKDQYGDCPTMIELYEKLADYEDAEEQGLLIRLPCKIGTKVWVVLKYVAYNSYLVDSTRFNLSMIDKIGESVFFTREEAEAFKERIIAS